MLPTRYTEEMVTEYSEKGYWKDITYSDLYEANAKNHGDKEAICDDEKRLTWAQANEAVDKIAAKLVDLGFKKDDVLVCHLPNVAELILFRVACERAGVINISAVRTLRGAEIDYALKLTNAKGYVAFRTFRDFDYWDMIQGMRVDLPAMEHVFILGDDVPEGAHSVNDILGRSLSTDQIAACGFSERKLKYWEVAWVEFTSGSTGLPKVIECPLALRTFAAQSHMARLRMSGDDTIAAFAPVSGAGRPGYYFPPFVACRSVLMEHFDADKALELIERERVTVAAVVPTQLIMMLESPNFDSYDLSSLRVLNTTGAPLPFQVAAQAEERFGCRIVNHYGGIDAGSVTSCDLDDPVEVRRFSVGKVHAGNEVKLVGDEGKEVSTGEIGEVWFRGPGSVGGYWRDSALTQEAWGTGWFCMGDLAKRDDEGNIMIVGRRKNVIIRGGQNIYPTEIENTLQMQPKVASVALVPMPDPVMGEKACAVVVPKHGEQLELGELVDFLRQRNVAAFKFPERLMLLDSMPLVSDAKLDRTTLVELVRQEVEAETIT